MSGSVYNVAMNSTCFTPMRGHIEYIDNGINYTGTEERAGRVGMVLGAVASIFIPFAAPAVWGALTSSTGILSGLGAAASSGSFSAGLINVIGQAATSAIMNAGTAYLSGARGTQVWAAAGQGALSGASGAMTRGLGAAKGVAGAAGAAGQGAVNGVGAVNGAVNGGTKIWDSARSLAGGIPQAGIDVGVGAAQKVVGGAPVTSGGVMNGLRKMFGNVSGDTLRRMGAVLINAAVNNQDMGQLNGMVEEQRRELAALAASNQQVYQQRIAEAQNILAAADRSDPDMARLWAVADAAGTEHRQFRQAQRNIATKQGGSLDSGQAKAYERGAALHIARTKALAGNRAYREATIAQNQLRSMGAQLLGPDTHGLNIRQVDADVAAAGVRGTRELNTDTWGGVIAGLTEGWGDYRPTTSPDPTGGQTQEDEDSGWGNFGNWGRGD